MSGIAGIFHRDKSPVTVGELRAMGTALAHRGPDGLSTFNRDYIGFVHCMLHDTPESLAESLPCWSDDDALVLTFHGRIDNRSELYDRIGWERPIQSVTDSELVLAAYRKWRSGCAEHFLGDFAFAIWDRDRRKMFCARDHFGICPFYYFLSPSVFAFASEIKGLLALAEIPCNINEDRVADFLACIVADKESTFYRDIFRLPPAHSLEIGLGSAVKKGYYRLQPQNFVYRNSHDYVENFRELFFNAVRSRLRSAFPVGTFLSGGLDSSSITCTAAGPVKEALNGPLHTFSGIFDRLTGCDERNYFLPVIKKYQVVPHFFVVDEASPGEAFDKIAAIGDEPFWAPHIFMGMGLMSLAVDAGVRVLLDGHDGDAAVSYGYQFLTELAASGRVLRVLTEYRKTGLSPVRIAGRVSSVYRDIFLSLIPGLRLFRERKAMMEDLKPLSARLLRQTAVRKRLRQHYRQLPHPGLDEATYHLRNLNQPLHPYALEFFDKLASRSGLSLRFPFFDKRLLEFCLSVPAEQKFSEGKDRAIVRRALVNVVPDGILQRTRKTDFMPSLVDGYLNRDRQWFEITIDSIMQQSYKYLDKGYCVVPDFSKEYNGSRKGGRLSRLLASASLSRWVENSTRHLRSAR